MKKLGAMLMLSMALISGVFATETNNALVCDMSYDDTSSKMYAVQKLCVDKTVIIIVYNEEDTPLGVTSLNKTCECVTVKEKGEQPYIVGKETNNK